MDKLVSPVLAPAKSDFRKQLDLYRRTMPFKAEYIGMTNPYDSSVIQGASDYDFYLREKLFHDMCEKAALEELEQRTRTIAEKASRRIKLTAFFAAVFIVFFFAAVLPSSKSSSMSEGYTNGRADGYSIGYEEGRSAGYKEGAAKQPNFSYSSNNSSSGSSSVRLPTSQEGNQTVVYVTATGSKYHRSSCSYLSNSKRETTLSAAISSGYTACSRCKPPQ